MTKGLRQSSALFKKHPTAVARDLLGIVIKVGELSGRIVETEAYTGPPEDLASHAHTRASSAAEIMRTAGHIYIYSIHGGIATNITCGEGEYGAVLLRGLEPEIGISKMIENRSRRETKISKTWDANDFHSLTTLTNGPNKLTEALGIKKEWNNTSVGKHVNLLPGESSGEIVATQRIGISEFSDHLWRFCDAGSEFLSRPLKQ